MGWTEALTAERLDAIRGHKDPNAWKRVTELEGFRKGAEAPTGPLDPDPQSYLSKAAGILVQDVFLAIWRLGVTKIDSSKQNMAEQDRSAPLVRTLEGVGAQATHVEHCLEWLQNAERFVALRFPSYFQPILLHMRSTVAYITAGYLLLLVCIASYPFQPRRCC